MTGYKCPSLDPSLLISIIDLSVTKVNALLIAGYCPPFSATFHYQTANREVLSRIDCQHVLNSWLISGSHITLAVMRTAPKLIKYLGRRFLISLSRIFIRSSPDSRSTPGKTRKARGFWDTLKIASWSISWPGKDFRLTQQKRMIYVGQGSAEKDEMLRSVQIYQGVYFGHNWLPSKSSRRKWPFFEQLWGL